MREKEKITDKQKKTQEFSERRALFLAGLEVLKAKKNFFILTVSLALCGTLLGHFFQQTTYSTAATMFVQPLEEPGAAEYLLNQHIGRTTKAERIDTYMRYLSSDAFFLSVAQKTKYHEDYPQLKLKPVQSNSVLSLGFWKKQINYVLGHEEVQTKKDNEPMTIEDLVGALKAVTTFETDFSHFIHIKTKTLEPRTAQIVANIAAEEFAAITNQRGIQEIEQITAFVKTKMQETEERIKKNEIDLIDFKKKNSIISTDTSSSLLADRYTKIASQLETSKLQFEENQRLIDFFEKGQQSSIDAASQNGKSETFGAKETALILQRKIEQLKKQKGLIIAQEDTNQEWRIKEIDEELNKTIKAFKVYSQKSGASQNFFLYMNPQKILQKINELKEENEILKNKIGTHSRAVDQVKVQIEQIPSMAQTQFVLENNLRLDNEGYAHLKNKLTELEIQRISQKKEVRIDQMAQFPRATLKGNLFLKLVFSSLIALLLAVSIIIGIESVDPTIKHRSDLNDCGLEFIGEIPLIPAVIEGKNKNSISSSKIVASQTPESLESMAFKYVRARLESYKYKFKKEHLTICVTSSGVHEGKSFVTANLAASVAQLKRTVLLIDCDLRRPSQNAYFEVTPQHGLVDLLNLNNTLDEVVIKNVHPGLDYIPAGFCHENSTEYISSEKFRVLLAHLKKQYEYIIIDTPPVFAAVDSAIIASYSDIPIMLANFRETKKYTLSEAYNQLMQVSYKRVFGLVNKAIVSTARFHYYGYHTYQPNEKANIGPSASQSQNSADIQKFLDNLNKSKKSG